MKLAHRRHFLHLAAGAAAVPAVLQRAWAQTYPVKPVRIVVGFSVGGMADLAARLVGRGLSERLGQQFIIESRAGAGGNIATELVVRARPDGYTLLLIGANDAWNATLYDNLKYDFLRDITPVASIARLTGVLVVNPSFPANSVPELIAYAKSNPGKIRVGSGGVGSPAYVFWELFKSMTGVDMLHVPYRGEAPALADLIGGQVQVMLTVAPSIEYIRAGKVRPLAVTTATRSEGLPDIPTVGEFVAGYDANGWAGIGVPRNTSVEIIYKLNSEINASLGDPGVQKPITELGHTMFASSPAEFGKYIAEFTEKWGKVIRAANIKL